MLRESEYAMVVAGPVALLTSLVFQPLVIGWLRGRNVVDVPVERSSHVVATPRGGGIAVILGVVAGVGTGGDEIAIGLLAGIVVAAVVGGVEDVRGVRIGTRLLLTAIAAALLVAVLMLAELESGPRPLVLGLAIPWTLAVVNAVNFMDGINGISAITGVVGGTAYAAMGQIHDVGPLTILGVSVAAAALGFVPYNVPHARVFLGDVGSYGLGAAFAGMSLLALSEGLPPEATVAPLLLYLADTGWTMARRIWDGEPFHLPHKRHSYQRLVAQGNSHAIVSLAVGLVTLLCSALGLASIWADAWERVTIALTMLILLAAYVASPYLFRRRESVC